MNDLKDILTPSRILINKGPSSKKRILEQICHLCAAAEEVEIFYEFLLSREKLGSTALGDGVALPHCRIPNLKKSIGCFVKLEQGVDFDAPDGQNVYLVFGLFVPEAASSAHLDILANLAKIFSQSALREKIKASKSTNEIYDILTAS